MDSKEPGPDILIRLRPLAGSEVPWAHRLKRLLKHSLRAFGFRAVEVREVREAKAEESDLPDSK